ncbi:hypothetical protein K435DRAFT_803426 [Dendrothele bispora CBS 962.96]|uniref:Uncharacterized protein n=1 Tax=Dendrothele bispora (strain CBS 962.96) TaxID=1314807 RepID=A0A4S8LHG8_DENBC|nr:hypothetical protein K435DRAFT_803426 [Dendrothele bispora CBS 962.96]
MLYVLSGPPPSSFTCHTFLPLLIYAVLIHSNCSADSYSQEFSEQVLPGSELCFRSSPSFRVSLAFYSDTSNLLNLVNNHKSVHVDKRFTGTWREKTARPIQTTPGTEVGPGQNVEDELSKTYMELEKIGARSAGSLDSLEKNDYSTKEVIEALTYSGVGLLPTLRHTFDLQFQLEFTLHRRTKGSSMCVVDLRVRSLIIVVRLRGGCKSLMSLQGGGDIVNLELGEGRRAVWLNYISNNCPINARAGLTEEKGRQSDAVLVTLTGYTKLKHKARAGNDLVQFTLDYWSIPEAPIAIRRGRMKRRGTLKEIVVVPTGPNGPEASVSPWQQLEHVHATFNSSYIMLQTRFRDPANGHGVSSRKTLAAFSIIYNSKPSLVFFIDDIHRSKLSTTATSFLVAYASLASTAPNHEKGKGNGKGETYEERYRTRLQIQVFRIQMRLARHISWLDPFFYPFTSLQFCALLHIPTENAKKESMKKAAESVQDPLERLQGMNCPNDLKGNHCKHFLFTKVLRVPLGSGLYSYFDYNYEVFMLMKESLEIKGKTLDKDLYYERPLVFFPLISGPFLFLHEILLKNLMPFKSSNEKQARSPPDPPKQRKELEKKFRSVHRVPGSPTRVVTLSRVGKVFIKISGHEYLYVSVV